MQTQVTAAHAQTDRQLVCTQHKPASQTARPQRRRAKLCIYRVWCSLPRICLLVYAAPTKNAEAVAASRVSTHSVGAGLGCWQRARARRVVA